MGPFIVMTNISDVFFKLEFPPTYSIHHVINIRYLRKYNPTVFSKDSTPPTPVLNGGEERYIVENIIKYRKRRINLQ